MFRKGGNVGNGIMSGITDRVQAQSGFLPGSTAGMKGAMGVTEEGIDLANQLPTASPYTPMEYENINVEELVGKPKTSAEYIEELKAGAGEYGGMDPLTSFLLTAGPSIAGATSFSDAIGRLKPAAERLIKDAEAKAKYDRDLRLAGVKLGIGAQEQSEARKFDLKKLDLSQENQVKFLNDQRAYDQLQTEDKRKYDAAVKDRARAYAKLDTEDQRQYEKRLIDEGRAFELQKIKKEQEFQEGLIDKQMKLEEELTTKDFIEQYGGSSNQAGNRARFENENLESKMIEKFGGKNVDPEPFVGGTQHGTLKSKESNKNVGKVYFDVTDGKVKRLRKTKDGFKFEIIRDIDTFKEEETTGGPKLSEYQQKIVEGAEEYRKKKQEEAEKRRQENIADLPEFNLYES